MHHGAICQLAEMIKFKFHLLACLHCTIAKTVSPEFSVKVIEFFKVWQSIATN